MLSLPLRVERKQQRAAFRISPPALDPPLEARCTSTIERDLKFTLRVTNVSCSGIAGVTTDPVAKRVRVGDLFWSEFVLPGDQQKIEFIVQLAYYHTIRQSGDQRTKLGCGFCPTDDPITHEDNLRRLERFVMERQQAMLKRAAARLVRRR